MKILKTLVLLWVLAAVPAWAGDLKDELMELEKKMWTAWGQGDGDVFRKHLTADHVQIVAGAGRVEGRETVAAEVDKHECRLKQFEFSDAVVRHLGPDVVVLSYRARQDASCWGVTLPASIYATAIYLRGDGKWKSAGYQETPVD